MFGFKKKPVITGVVVYGVVPQSPLPLPSAGRKVTVAFAEVPVGRRQCVEFYVRLPRGTNVAAILASADAASNPQALAVDATPGEDGLSVTIVLSGPAVGGMLDNVADGTPPAQFAVTGGPAIASPSEMLGGLVRSLKALVLKVVDV